MLLALQRQKDLLAEDTGDLHEHGCHRETVERMLAALPFLDAGKICTSTVGLQIDLSPETKEIAVQSAPLQTGFGRLLLCQWRRERKRVDMAAHIWWWRCQTELGWMLDIELEKARRKMKIDPDTLR